MSKGGKAPKAAPPPEQPPSPLAGPTVPEPDPALEKAKLAVVEWAGRVERGVKGMEQVQAILRGLSQRQDGDRLELQDLRIEADLLAHLKIDDVKERRAMIAARRPSAMAAGDKRLSNAGGPSAAAGNKSRGGSAGKRGKGKRPSSASKSGAQSSVSQQSNGEGGDISITALDEKKRQRLYNTLMGVYNHNPPVTAPSPMQAGKPVDLNALRAGLVIRPPILAGGEGSAVPGSPAAAALVDVDGVAVPGSPSCSSVRTHSITGSAATPTAADAGAGRARGVVNLTPSMSSIGGGAAAAAAAANGGGTAIDIRRPRDVPLPVWEELLAIRLRRLAAEERVRMVNADVTGQLERYAVLQEQVAVARYGLKSAFDAFAVIGGLEENGGVAAAMAAAAAPGAAGPARPGSRGPQSRGRGSPGATGPRVGGGK